MGLSSGVVRFLVLAALSALLDAATVASGSNVLFYSNSDALFRPRSSSPVTDDVPQKEASVSISPRGLAATMGAVMGLPLPRTTDRAVSQEINALLAPNPFLHASRVLIVSVDSAAAAVEGDWVKGAASDGETLGFVQQRRLDGSDVWESLRQELTSVRQAAGSFVRVVSKGQQKLDSGAQGNQLLDIAAALDTSGDGPLLASAHIALKVSAEDTEVSQAQQLKDAVDALLAGVSKQVSQVPAVVVLVLDSGKASGSLIPEDGALEVNADSGRGRVLLDSEEPSVTPEQVALNTVHLVVVLTLLVSLIFGFVLMFNMPITRDTLLYSGAKID